QTIVLGRHWSGVAPLYKVTQNTQLQAHFFQLNLSPQRTHVVSHLTAYNDNSSLKMTRRCRIQPDFVFDTSSTPANLNPAALPTRFKGISTAQAQQMASRERERPTSEIRKLTMRNTSIETSLDDCLEKCHQQTQSILYSKLPKEIRDMIFEYATAQYEDIDKKYKETAFWCRPGHRVSDAHIKLHSHILYRIESLVAGPNLITLTLTCEANIYVPKALHKTCTNLLLTCRRIWLEANSLPMKQAVFTFWMKPTRGPPEKHPDTRGYGQDPLRNDSLTKLNRGNLTTLHYFLQMFVAESMFFPNSEEATLFQRVTPKVLRITVRHTDWWYWEDDEPLRLENAWVQRILDAPLMKSVNEFSLELETLERNKGQLQVIVDRLIKMRGRASLSYGLITRFEIHSDPHIDDKEYEPYKGMKILDYRVVALKWKRSPIREEDLEDAIEELSVKASTARRPGRQPLRCGFPSRQSRLRLAGLDRWSQNDFSFADYLMRKESMERAVNTAQQMEQRFIRMVADIEARKLEAIWREEGSLMKFEEE
ncbi:hypothetical protein HII31_04085, partial [Pseudocercospora fuligena]